MDGVVRSPSLFSMTRALPPSMIATHELVVPRSMPMILAMVMLPCGFASWAAAPPCGVSGAAGRRFKRARGSALRGDAHQRGAQQAFVQHVALLEQARDRAGGDRRVLGHAHGLVALGVEGLARTGGHLDQAM